MAAVSLKARRRLGVNSKWQIYLDRLVDARRNEMPDYLVVEPRVRSGDRVTAAR